MRNAAIADTAPTSDRITQYDEEHFALYLQLLDASRAEATDEEMCRTALGRDPTSDAGALQALQSHLARARWMCEHGFKDLLKSRQ